MKRRHGYAVLALCALTGMLLVSSALAADADATGLVPTIWLDFENQSASASSFKSENKGSASVSFTGDGKYKAGANNGYALDTTRCTPYTNQGTFSTAGQDFTVSAVMTLGTNPTGITLSLRSNAGDLVIRRGTDSGSIVLAFAPEQKDATNFLNAAISGGDSDYHLVSLVFRSTGTELYVDGESKGSTTDFTLWHGTSALNRLQFGTHLGGPKAGEVACGGYVDDFRVHDAALTTAQMKVIAFEYGLIEFSDSLQVKGSPANWGTPDPAYGVVANISQGQSFTCSASGLETAVTKIIPIGYSLFSVASGGNSTLKATGNTSSFSYTHGTTADLLVWDWAQSNLVTVAAGEGGMTTGGDWVGYEETFDVVATPHGGYKFLYWTGDTAGIDVLALSIVVPAVTKPLSLAAKFIDENVDETIQWVSPDGDDANDGYSESSPKKTILSAVGVLSPVASAKTCFVYLKPGTYTLPSSVAPISITGAIQIVGTGNTPEDVIVQRTDPRASANPSGGRSTQDCSIFHLDNSEALVANLVMHYGSAHQPTSGTTAGSAWIGANGGTISNCVVRGGRVSHPYAVSAGILMKGPGLVTHCVITNNVGTSAMESAWAGVGLGSAVVMTGTGGRLENCLIQDNRGTAEGGGNDGQEKMSTIYAADSSSIVNCTVISNRARRCAGIYADGSGVTVKNCVMAGNFDVGITTTNPNWMGTGTAFLACATDDASAINESCRIGTVGSFFKDYAGNDYRPAPKGPLVNAGVNYEGMAPIDLGGNKRLIGSKVDIGCYEAAAAEFRIHLR
ncbi:MAG: right-handed parallel beta-helix repeat-containing protein [Kiritimatiellae bacterium]|nr:right-handed parallel beta-helix repeat-containing protein [Kiritimatiellia bacterium]